MVEIDREHAGIEILSMLNITVFAEIPWKRHVIYSVAVGGCCQRVIAELHIPNLFDVHIDDGITGIEINDFIDSGRYNFGQQQPIKHSYDVNLGKSRQQNLLKLLQSFWGTNVDVIEFNLLIVLPGDIHEFIPIINGQTVIVQNVDSDAFGGVLKH